MTRTQAEDLQIASDSLMQAEIAFNDALHERNRARNRFTELLGELSIPEPTKRGRPAGSRNKPAENGAAGFDEKTGMLK